MSVQIFASPFSTELIEISDKVAKYVPCEVTCTEPFEDDPAFVRASCRHGQFAVTTSASTSADHTRTFCRGWRARELSEDYAAGVRFDADEIRTLKQFKLVANF